MDEKTQPRGQCRKCLRAPLNCYCALVAAFDPGIRFLVFRHRREARKHVATGRITHDFLEGSVLLTGYHFDADPRAPSLLADPAFYNVVLFPGAVSVNLSPLSPAERAELIPAGRRLSIVLVDGTWTTARKAVERSPLLRALPRISFDPPARSRIRIRQQPEAHCLTTLEAAHHAIELLAPPGGRAHDRMLDALDAMIDRQIELARREVPGAYAWESV
jgi:DTW domain-containing protein YfiP